MKSREEVRQLMLLAISAGETMLKNGAETYRVEDTMNRICSSRKNIYNVDSFVTHTGIFMTLEYEYEVFTQLKRVRNSSNNLQKVSMVNDFSRAYVSSNMSVEEGLNIIDEINQAKDYSKLVKLLCGSSGSGFFSLMFGGGIFEFISSFLASLLALIIIDFLSSQNLNFFLDSFLGALLASIFSYITLKIGLTRNVDVVIIGSIMCLVPGVSITNSIRDTMSGDSLSGLSKGMEAIFSALAIAFGVGVVLNLHMKGLI